MTIDEMKENGSQHWKQQALRQVLRAEAEEGFKRITYPIYDKELYKQAYFAAAEPREEKISALEKENAELKAHSDYVEEKLAKAKDLIGDLCYVYQLGKNELAIWRVMAEAEQFLKEEKE